MFFNVEMHIVGVKRVGAWPEHGRKPPAGRQPHRVDIGRFGRAGLTLNRDAPLVHERNCNEVDGQPFAMSANLAACHAVSTATSKPGPVSIEPTFEPSVAAPNGATIRRT
jgi:hypothetical protein